MTNRVERLLFATILLALPLALYFDHLYRDLFHWFNDEDGFSETLTVIILIIGCGFSLNRAWQQKQRQRLSAAVCSFILAVMFIFGAGEELSWGQRFFSFDSPAWFMKYNQQQETSVHNLVVGGVSLSKWVFGKLLTLGILGYFLVWPRLWAKLVSDKSSDHPLMINRIKALELPVPATRHTVLLIAVMGAIRLMGSSRRWEFSEMLVTLIVVMSMVYSEQHKE